MDRLPDEESRKYPCLNLHSMKIKAKVLQENHRRLPHTKVRDIPHRKFEETLTLEVKIQTLGDFEIGEDELLPKHKARIHYIPEYSWKDCDTINSLNEFKSCSLLLV